MRRIGDFKLRFYSADLRKVQAFYTILGIRWQGGGGPEEIAASGLPVSVTPETDRGLPHLWGEIASVELVFYLDREQVKSTRPPNTIFMIYYDESEDLLRIVADLKENKLYRTDGRFHKEYGGILFDPDGRAVEIFGPHALRF